MSGGRLSEEDQEWSLGAHEMVKNGSHDATLCPLKSGFIMYGTNGISVEDRKGFVDIF
jgi:hypothetical protein